MSATIRLRLTLVHTLVFAVMAVLLVICIYLLTARTTATQRSDPWTKLERSLDLPAGSLAGQRPLLTIPRRRTSPGVTHGNVPPLTLRRVATGVQTQTRSDLLTKLLIFSGTLVLVTTALTFLIGWVMAGRSLRPLRRITARARTISERDLREPIALQGPHDELRELAETFDEMLARLDRAFEGQRLFAANASHELRTPLTRIRAKLDVTLAKPDVTRADLERMAVTIRDAIDRSAALIDSLLVLARTRGGVARQTVALHEIARSSLDELREPIAERGISVTARLDPCEVAGDPILLEHLVRNVLDNAVTHNLDGGWIDVVTEADDACRLVASNVGPVIPAASVPELFEPLHRGHADRMNTLERGFGLGLAIVRAVAEAHRGSVLAEAQDRGGLRVEVTLPRALPVAPEPPSLPASTAAVLGAWR